MITENLHNMDITSANSTAFMIVNKLFPAGFPVEGFGTDQAVSGDNMQIAETRIGVDGKMSAGVVVNVLPVTITLEANSPTYKFFRAIEEFQSKNKSLCPVTLTVITPSVGQTTVFTNGVLQTAPSMANIGSTLEATQWVFHFEKKTQVAI